MCNCACGWPIYTAYKRTYNCPKCGETIECDGITLPASVEQTDSGKPTRWNYFVRMLRKPGDKGIGDTVQRIAAKFGGERFKAFAARVGMPCGCTERQEEWNRLYPY